MPTGQQYATNVPQTTLTGAINATTTLIPVTSSSNWPATPFTAVLGIGTSVQEPIDVTAIVGVTWTVVRNIDGTTGFAHGIGETVTHADIGRDFREARSHIDASSSNDASGHNVHGLTTGSSVVGTTDAQTLSNKTISAGTYTGAQVMGSGSWTGTGVVTENAVGISGISGATTATRIAGATAGGPPVAGTFSTNDIVIDTGGQGFWFCTAGGTPGTWVPIGSRFLLNSTNLSANSTSITLPPSYASLFKNLLVEIWGRDAITGSNNSISINFNGDNTGFHYTWESLTLPNGAAGITTSTSSGTVNSMIVGLAGAGASASGVGASLIHVPQFNNTSFKKAVFTSNSNGDASGSGAVGGGLNLYAGQWASTAAITSIQIALQSTDTWTAGSVVNIYGTN